MLSPTEGRVEGCSEDNLVAMAVARMVGMMAMGEEVWMQRARGTQEEWNCPSHPKFMFSRRPLTR